MATHVPPGQSQGDPPAGPPLADTVAVGAAEAGQGGVVMVAIAQPRARARCGANRAVAPEA
jgi:hypothetical protein